MRAPLAPALLASALLASALLSACGTGLYDAAGIPALDGDGVTCDAGQIVCGGTCTNESRTHCGATCEDCTAAGTPPANGAWACLPGGACGYECADPGVEPGELLPNGFLKCDGGCCAATAVSAGPASTCAQLDDGTVRCWGANGSGQLGDGTTVDRPAPVAVPLGAAAVAVAVGAGHGCAVLQGGQVVCWGANGSHQVSASASSPILAPTPTAVTDGIGVAVGDAHSCALRANGAVTCWGSDAAGQLGPGPGAPIASGAASLTAGADHTCALVGGAVKCWGANGNGQLGGTPAAGIATPVASGIALVAAGASQSCASIGTSPGGNIDPVLQCWGSGIGVPFLPADPQPTPAIPMKDGSQSTIRFDISLLAVGRAHVCVQRPGELLHCFGADNAFGQLGAASVPAGSREEWPVSGNLAASALAAGADHTCAILASGPLRCWGANGAGQLGSGSTVQPAAGTVVAPSGR